MSRARSACFTLDISSLSVPQVYGLHNPNTLALPWAGAQAESLAQAAERRRAQARRSGRDMSEANIARIVAQCCAERILSEAVARSALRPRHGE